MGGSQSSHEERPVIVGVDGSDHSKRAFDWYLNFRSVFNCGVERPVIFVYNIETEPVSESAIGLMDTTIYYDKKSHLSHLEKQKLVSKKIEGEFMKRCKNANAKCQFRERFGRPGENIIEESKAENAHLIVVGTRGQTTIRRTILGSVSDYIVHQSDIPVAVVPPSSNNTSWM